MRMNKIVVSIHQPDFMPWLGLFKKLSKSDIFILLDHTINNVKDSNSWLRRVKIIVNGIPFWYSINLHKEKNKSFIPINKFQNSSSSLRQHGRDK